MRFVVVLLATCLCLLAQNAKKPFDAEAMMRINRVSEPQLSSDGKLVAFTVERPDVPENKKTKQIYLVPVAGGPATPLTTEGSNERPRWTHDSSRIVFVSTRNGSSQVWSMKADGSEQKAITSLSTEASGVIVSPDDKWIVFSSEVYPECTDEACNKSKAEALKNEKVK